MWSRFSLLKASDVTIWSGIPFAAHTKASDTPVLPPVYSTTEPPGFSRPSVSAASTMASAIRSFMLPVGFSYSSLTKMRALPGGTRCRSGTRRVWPIVARMVMREPSQLDLHGDDPERRVAR
jgi:hypothetical protein